MIIGGTVYLSKRQPRKAGYNDQPEDHFILRVLFGGKVLSLMLMAAMTAPFALSAWEALPVFAVTGFVCAMGVISVIKDCCIDSNGKVRWWLIALTGIITVVEVELFGNTAWMAISCLFLVCGKLYLKWRRGATTRKDTVFVRSYLCWLFFQGIHLFLEYNYFRLPTQWMEGAAICGFSLLLVTVP